MSGQWIMRVAKRELLGPTFSTLTVTSKVFDPKASDISTIESSGMAINDCWSGEIEILQMNFQSELIF